ncbi:hypothetical protein [Streptomyces sp. P9-A4]|uniref:hypothetical protein n=1 Tax=Streptomyces sp. P9-A4 TaxID=3072285 RepID=UPI002FC996B9
MTVEQPVRDAVFVAPAERDEKDRMRRVHAAAARQFQVSASGPEVWGWQGRTLGRRAGDCWLRVVSTTKDKAGGRSTWRQLRFAGPSLANDSASRRDLRGSPGAQSASRT